MEPIVFYTAGTLTLLFIILMIFQNNPIASAVSLVASFFALAVLYVSLDAHFVATLQILVYAGAIMVLFIFVIMLLNLKPEELSHDRFNIQSAAVVFFGLSFFGFLAYFFSKIPLVSFEMIESGFGTAKEIGKLMFSDYVIAFEVIGLLLLVGIVGAILLGKKHSQQD